MVRGYFDNERGEKKQKWIFSPLPKNNLVKAVFLPFLLNIKQNGYFFKSRVDRWEKLRYTIRYKIRCKICI